MGISRNQRGDRFGRHRMLVIGIGVFTGGSAGAALAPAIGALVAARTLQGVGAALITPLTLTIAFAEIALALAGVDRTSPPKRQPT